MTVIRTNTAEGGTNGTAVTAANSGGTSGNAFDTVAAGTNTLTFSNASAFYGTMSYDIGTDTTTAQAVLRWGDTLGLAQAGMRFFIKLPAVSPNVQMPIGFLYTTTTVRAAAVLVNASGHLVIQDSTSTNLFTSVAAIPTGVWVRIELWVIPGTSSTTGQIGGGFATGAAALTESYTSPATVNASTGNIIRAQVGKLGGSYAAAQHFQIDAVALSNTGAFIGGAAIGSPSASAGTNQTGVEPWSAVTLSGTDSDAGGTISTRAWTQTGGTSAGTITNASTATATVTAPGTLAGDTLTFTYTVTDAGGPTASATTTVGVLAATERAVKAGAEVPMQIRTN